MTPASYQKPNARVIPLKQFRFKRETDVGMGAAVAFDAKYVFISSPDGEVLRTETPLHGDSRLHPIFEANAINNLQVYDSVLYALTSPNSWQRLCWLKAVSRVPSLISTISKQPSPREEPKHALFQSTDHGDSFTPIDQGLKECVGDVCSYLTSTQLFVTGNLIFSNAGAGFNLLLSSDQGRVWTALSGSVAAQVCYFPAFEIAGHTVFQGGECPLDFAYLKRGTLRGDMRGWAPGGELAPVTAPDLSNRNVMAISQQSSGSVVLAGAEGALLRSDDGGKSFEYVIENVSGDGTYPYIQHILFPAKNLRTPVIGGFDKVTTKPYLAYGTADGKNWTDISDLIPGVEYGTVSDLAEDEEGRIIAAVTDIQVKQVTIAQVVVN
jgi:hypothetical protein